MFHFYIPWKRQKTFDFLIFSGGIEMDVWHKMGDVDVVWEIKICVWKMSTKS